MEEGGRTAHPEVEDLAAWDMRRAPGDFQFVGRANGLENLGHLVSPSHRDDAIPLAMQDEGRRHEGQLITATAPVQAPRRHDDRANSGILVSPLPRLKCA